MHGVMTDGVEKDVWMVNDSIEIKRLSREGRAERKYKDTIRTTGTIFNHFESLHDGSMQKEGKIDVGTL